ncbi:hypothetical protein [Microbacterium sp. NPDC089695]|uniref:hypothetical protein n=1 Tax=Microbacterium sp. NPDC089695 TaxID=3364198 RepID=UPI0038272AF4
MIDENALPAAAPTFAAHFTDPIYDDPADEFAPFGTDEGWEILHEWAERRGELHPKTTLEDLIVESGFGDIVAEIDTDAGPGIPEPGGQIDAATIVVGTGFTILRLTGRIDKEGLEQTLKALDILIDHYGPSEALVRQRADLESWRQ